MNVGFNTYNSQLYGFNNSSIGKICVAKCEEENGQIYYNTGYWYCYENLCCVQYHRQENKT
jgi:hypothetical protein